MTPKDRYRRFCQQEDTIPIFSRDWWLDAVCGDAWDVCMVEQGGNVIATMPYHFRKKYGQLIISHPPLTQTLGPWLNPSAEGPAKRLKREKAIFTELIRQLPKFKHFRQNWHHSVTNWLPFYWKGFHQTTKYTYRLPELVDLDIIWSGFRENIKGDIRKAETRYSLQVRDDLSIEDFLDLNRQTFERQNIPLPYSREFVFKLDNSCRVNGVRKIFIAEDGIGQRHAAVYLVWDKRSAYYLMGGGNPKLRTSGATSLCMWEAIKFAATVTKSFDFEGSMIEPVEKFFRAFGAIQTPYFSIQKTPSKLFGIAQYIKDNYK